MTKAEIKVALEAKFDKVGDWVEGFPKVLGISRSDINVFSREKGHLSCTVFTDGNESFFVGKDPTEEEPALIIDFRQKVSDEIQTRVDANQIAAGLITASGDGIAEVSVYTLSGQDVSKALYVVYEKADETLGFRKIV
jgi:hypothetical protein